MASPSDGKGDYKVVIDQDADPALAPIRNSSFTAQGGRPLVPSTKDMLLNHPAFPIVCYCASSILMTVQFVVSGSHFNMNFLLLTIQSVVCVTCVITAKRLGWITFRDWDYNDARKWFPISFMLVSVIYTGSKSLQYLSVPVYTIFKNLTIILIAYGEVLWFGGAVTPLTFVSFALMVLSSLMAASPDLLNWLNGVESTTKGPGQSNVGYAWMMCEGQINCLVSAGYVLAMRKRIKVTNFKDWDSMFYNNLLSIPVLIIFSVLLEDWSMASLRLNFPEETRTTLLSLMAFSGAAAVFISCTSLSFFSSHAHLSYLHAPHPDTTAWCIRTNSSTTFSMVGALNKLPVAASGLIFFGDPATFANVSSIFVGFIAGLVYSAAKSAQSAQAKPPCPVSLDSGVYACA
ncbi:SPOSA6832_00082, partial [Sporobolomyces salmonicolor]